MNALVEIAGGSQLEPAAERNLGGCPTKYRPEYCQGAIDHAVDGASLTSFAASVGVARQTLTNWGEVYPEFFDAMAIAKARAAAKWEERARNIADGNGGPGAAQIVIFSLKNLGADDWQDKQQHEHVGRVQHSAMSYEEALEEAARRGLPHHVLEE